MGSPVCNGWTKKVARVVLPTMKVFLTIFPKFFPFFEQIQALGSDTM